MLNESDDDDDEFDLDEFGDGDCDDDDEPDDDDEEYWGNCWWFTAWFDAAVDVGGVGVSFSSWMKWHLGP